jgi:agmatine deiminase
MDIEPRDAESNYQVRAPRPRYWNGDPESFAASYLNAYVANGAVVSARFGDPERDRAARRALAQAFPKRQIVMLRIDNIADGGGGVHCLTQSMPMINERAEHERSDKTQMR